MKVLHVITSLNVGGAEGMLERLIAHERPFGDRSEVVTLMPPGVTGRRMLAAGVAVRSLGMTQGLPSIGAVARLGAIVRSSAPDVVMAWMHHAQAATQLALAVVRRRPPVIWNVRHSLNGYAQEKRLTRATLRGLALVSGRPAAIVYNSAVAAGQFRALGFRPRREIVIANGFACDGATDAAAARAALDARFGTGAGSVAIGMVARAHPMKDVPTLAAAFARVLAAGVDAHLLLVGDGMDAPGGDVAAALATLPRARWSVAGHRSDVGEWIGGLDMLVLPSAWGEGFPNVIGEAMAAGVPCVATDVGDSRTLIGDTGRVVPPRDPAALAAAMGEIARLDPDRRAALGARARDRIVRHYAIDAIADRYHRLYADVAAATPAARDAVRTLVQVSEP